MEKETLIENISADLSKSASIKNVYGDPVNVGDKTIIPVASVAYGFGGGSGHGMKSKKPNDKNDLSHDGNPMGEGAGGGGGMYSKAKGVYEITPTQTRFIPANPYRYLLRGFVIGFLVKLFFFSKKRKQKA